MTNIPLIEVPENPLPSPFHVQYVVANDGARLRIALAPLDEREAGAARGTVFVHPGWSEFIEKYGEVIEKLHTRGFHVAINDPRGQGYSHRMKPNDERGLIRDFSQFTDDLNSIWRVVKANFPPPYFILAHSMGGLIALDWLRREQKEGIAGAVLIAPLTGLIRAPTQRRIAKFLAHSLVATGMGKRHIPGVKEQAMSFETNKLTHDKARHERFRQLLLKAPEARAGAPKYAWVNAAFQAIDRIRQPQALADITMPLLLISAGADATVDRQSHDILAAQYDQIELVQIEDAYHEILMEADQYQTPLWTAIDQYLESRLECI
ncbi:MAG: alpha/beta hydrolase [Pseudomonadota bacterium]